MKVVFIVKQDRDGIIVDSIYLRGQDLGNLFMIRPNGVYLDLLDFALLIELCHEYNQFLAIDIGG